MISFRMALAGLALFAMPVHAQILGQPPRPMPDPIPTQPYDPPNGHPPVAAAQPTPAQRFATANTTHDGRLTREQASRAGMTGVVHNFDKIDLGHKGWISEADIREYAISVRRDAPKPTPPNG